MDPKLLKQRGRPKKKVLLELENERLKKKQMLHEPEKENERMDIEYEENDKKDNINNGQQESKPSGAGEFKLKKKKKVIEEQDRQKKEAEMQKKLKQDQIVIKIQVQQLNINKTFQDVMSQAKNPTYLAILKNNLSQCYRQLQDKEQLFVKKWKQLRNANISQIEYLTKEKELKVSETEEKLEIKQYTIVKLHQADIMGFNTLENIIDDYKVNYLNEKTQLSEEEKDKMEFILDEDDQKMIMNDQILLLQKLMKEKNLISSQAAQDSLLGNNYNQDVEEEYRVKRGQEGQNEQNLELEQPKFKTINLCKFFEETSALSSNPMSTQNLNKENDKNKEKDKIKEKQKQKQKEKEPKIIDLEEGEELSENNNNNQEDDEKEEGEGDDMDIEDGESRSLLNGMFESYEKFISVQKKDYFILEKRLKTLLLDIKSDELFTDNKFQREDFDKFQALMRQYEGISDSEDLNDHQINQLIEISAYVINNVHYYKKFKLNCNLIHPMDLIVMLQNRDPLQNKQQQQSHQYIRDDDNHHHHHYNNNHKSTGQKGEPNNLQQIL